MPNLLEVNNTEVISNLFVNDAVSDIINRANHAQNLVEVAATQVDRLATKQTQWLKDKTAHFHAREYHVPKPVLWADESYDFDYENDGSITLNFYNDDDSTLVVNATSELTIEINRGVGFIAFDDLKITSVMIIDADESAYKVHVSNELVGNILEDYINCSLSTNQVEYSTSLHELQKSAADQASYNANPNAYYGMSGADYSIKACKVRKESNADFHDNAYTHYGKYA